MHRDGLRCAVPYCRCTLWLDVHHLHPRHDQGGHEAANLVVLCDRHHAQLHNGLLDIERDEQGRIVCRHADGRRFRPDHGPRPDLTAPVLEALASGPAPFYELASNLGLSGPRMVNLLESLTATGDIIRRADGSYVRARDVHAQMSSTTARACRHAAPSGSLDASAAKS